MQGHHEDFFLALWKDIKNVGGGCKREEMWGYMYTYS